MPIKMLFNCAPNLFQVNLNLDRFFLSFHTRLSFAVLFSFTELTLIGKIFNNMEKIAGVLFVEAVGEDLSEPEI